MRATLPVLGLLLAGVVTYQPVEAAIITPTGFESGTLAGLSLNGQGNATVLSSLGAITPLFGTQMGLLSNGPGDLGGATDTVELLSDPFGLIAADTLRFSVRRLTSEFTGSSADPSRLDSFLIQLFPVGGGLPVLIHSSDVSATGFGPVAGGMVSTSAGETFFEETAWSDFNVTGLTGDYRLSFRVQDAGDNSFDSGLLIDADANPIPEPATILTLLGGAAAVLLVKRTGRSGRRV